ncbi:EamA family transporter [Anaerocolumna sp. MB42-C2]|uniref:EamA family transporter n=1 Tax=Anaerocolumna sp. MB42-C2 TaxID=3070997 RepID=UPI0027DFAFED|nr:EamA family transporter [Anaerocolumna sp. MB42-C2]WMJ89797.1 EamA family transporter [Anaerocolumna sp. MB42-C2]
MIESIKKNKYGILLMIISSICVCLGQLLWKLSSKYGMLFLLIGFVLYGIGAIIMIIAYRYGSLSVLQPILSLNYVISIFFGVVILNESIHPAKLLGIIVIICGVFFIVGGDE